MDVSIATPAKNGPALAAVARAQGRVALRVTGIILSVTLIFSLGFIFGKRTSAPSSGVPAAESLARAVPVFDAMYLRNPKPPYPPMSKRLREEGRVELRVYVLADGSAGKVEVRKSSGHARLDESARVTVKKWRFIPARRGDQAINAWMVVPISFQFNKES
jgi:TonB family protein